jgi:hypothetical protein
MPAVAVALIFLAWLARESRFAIAIEACVPLLVAASIACGDERLRLFAFGVIVAAAFATAAAVVPGTFPNSAGVAIAAVLVLRWIPLANVELWRELVVLLGVLALLPAGRLALLPLFAVALVTPTHPGKAMLYPFIVAALVFVVRSVPLAAAVSAAMLVAAHFGRAEHAPLWVAAAIAVATPLLQRARLMLPATAAAVALFALWPWSGVAARAMPNFLWAAPPSPGAQVVGQALAASESIDVAVPPGTKQIVVTVSGANVARLKAQRVIGSINATPVRIGDAADFGFMRREHFFFARNPLPRLPVADIRGYGQGAFLYGAGRIVVPAAESLHIAAAPDLPPNARLQVESAEFSGQSVVHGAWWSR